MFSSDNPPRIYSGFMNLNLPKHIFVTFVPRVIFAIILEEHCSGIVSGVPSKSSPGVHSSGSVGIVFRSQSENILEISTKSLFENSLEVALDLFFW